MLWCWPWPLDSVHFSSAAPRMSPCCRTCAGILMFRIPRSFWDNQSGISDLDPFVCVKAAVSCSNPTSSVISVFTRPLWNITHGRYNPISVVDPQNARSETRWITLLQFRLTDPWVRGPILLLASSTEVVFFHPNFLPGVGKVCQTFLCHRKLAQLRSREEGSSSHHRTSSAQLANMKQVQGAAVKP